MEYEQQVAGAGYILSFFNDIEQLNNYYAAYVNAALGLKSKYPNEESLKNMSVDDRKTIGEAANAVRVWIVRCYIKAKALRDKVPEFTSDELDESYRKICNTITPEVEDVEKFVIEINKAFVNGVLVDLLNQARDIYARLTE